LLQDHAFAAPSVAIDPHAAFALSPAMRSFLTQQERDPDSSFRTKGLQQGLIDALYSKGTLHIDYDAAETLNAAEAFTAKRGNCLSLVLMTAAFAKALGLEITYQSVAVDETWSRANGAVFGAGHVNVTLGRRNAILGTERRQVEALTIDFFPPEATVGQRVWAISEATVIAMYLNNRAAEALAAGSLDNAYWWARAAIQAAPTYAAAYNTLGVVYRRRGMLDPAERAMREVLKHDAYNTTSMANLATVIRVQAGRETEAREWEERAASLSRFGAHPPFHFLDVGVAEMERGNYVQARAAFRQELRRDPFNAEAHFWLGRAHAHLGELGAAEGAMAQALEHSTTRRNRDLYAAKLDRIKAARQTAVQ
jgi:tetratricopeptide (TPR) repeat protein